MKRPTYTQQDILIRWTVLPVYVLVLNWLLLGNAYWATAKVFSAATLLAFLFYYAHWLVNNDIAQWFHRLYPSFKHTLLRVVLSVVVISVHTSGITGIIYLLYRYLAFAGYQPQPDDLRWGLLFGVVVVLLVTAIYESVNLFEQWQRTLTQTEQFRKANLESQFESLKQQINPHFLFNSLNTLSQLVEESPNQATAYLDEMSSVYRYLLRANEQHLTTLKTELDFARSYFYLLGIRHGQAIQLVEAVDPLYYDHLIPPLTLQLLLENAVKHNIILPEQPLVIELRTTPDARLVVQNNLQRKRVQVSSSRVGLTNITSKYQLLGQGDMQVNEKPDCFRVTLPLLAASHLYH
ncbi:histidine kinase [Nibrella saemangeumensis]|uniref:Histidine kinase n=1 Tax=Nibrella saemangeumensis TaxID=1084526 RepID=A0ABP8MUQ9_9BACT